MHPTNARDQPTTISYATVPAASTTLPRGADSPVCDVPAPVVRDLLDAQLLSGTGPGMGQEDAAAAGCGAPGCPGCVPLAADLERRLGAYRPTTDPQAWAPVAGQCRCLVRRTAPRSASILRGRLSTLWAILAGQLTDCPDTPVADLVTTAAVNRLLASLQASHTERTRANIRAAAAALHRAAAGVPHTARNSADEASGPRTRNRALSARSARLLAEVCSGRPLHTVCTESHLGFSALRPLEGHLPPADLAAHRDALRG